MTGGRGWGADGYFGVGGWLVGVGGGGGAGGETQKIVAVETRC